MPVSAFVHAVRAAPLQMVVLWAYSRLPVITYNKSGQFGAMLAAFLIFDAAYLAEIVRAGIQGVPQALTKSAEAGGTLAATCLVLRFGLSQTAYALERRPGIRAAGADRQIGTCRPLIMVAVNESKPQPRSMRNRRQGLLPNCGGLVKRSCSLPPAARMTFCEGRLSGSAVSST